MSAELPPEESAVNAHEITRFGPFELDLGSGLLFRDGKELAVQPKAIEVLECLLESPQKTVSKQELLEKVWNGTAVTEHSLTETVRVLRGALGDDHRAPAYIQTVHRRGYRFIAPVRRDRSGPGNMGAPVASAGTGLDEVAVPSGAGVAAEQLAAAKPARRGASPWGLLGFIVGSLAVASVVSFSGRGAISGNAETASLSSMFSVVSPVDTVFHLGDEPTMAVSPDGSTVVFLAVEGNSTTLYARDLDGFETRSVAGHKALRGFVSPFFSPDGRYVGFFSTGGDVKAVSLTNGYVRTLCNRCRRAFDGGGAGGATWSPDGTIVFANGDLMRLSPAGEVEVIPAPRFDHPRGAYMWPSFLPGGEWVLATARSTGGIQGAQIVAVNIDSGETRQLVEDGTNPRYVATGHLLFVRAGDLMAAPFDLDRLEATGRPTVVVEGVMMSAEIGGAQFSVSENGTLAYRPGHILKNEYPIELVDHEGNVGALIEDKRDFRGVRFSPDGTHLAVTVTDGSNRSIWVYNLKTDGSQITPGNTDDAMPAWGPLGNRVAFVTSGGGTNTLRVTRADGFSHGGDDATTDIMSSNDPIWSPSWSPDGRVIAYHTWKNGGFDIWVVELDGPTPRPFLESESDEMAAEFSPDGRWLAYVLDGTVYVTDYPDRERSFKVSSDDSWGDDIRWTADGRKLYYTGNSLWEVPIETQPEFRVGTPRNLPGVLRRGRVFDVSPDGRQFAVVDRRRILPIISTEFNVVVNWFEELKQRVPTGR